MIRGEEIRGRGREVWVAAYLNRPRKQVSCPGNPARFRKESLCLQ